MATSATPNYAVFAIPAYLGFCFVPHFYATSLLKVAKSKADANGKLKQGKLVYNVANPRSADNAQRYSAAVDQTTFHKWERARGVHSNMLENAPFFVAAVILGVFAKLPAESLNNAMALYFVTRVLYMFSYIGVSKGVMAYGRTLWFTLGHAILGMIYYQAGIKVMNGEV